MIEHRHYYAMTAVVDEMDAFVVEDDVLLLYLPLAHNFGRLMHLTGAVHGADARVLLRSLSRRRSTRAGEADRLSKRASGVREDPYDDRGSVRRNDGRPTDARPLGAPRRPQGERASQSATAAPRTARSRTSPSDRLVYSKVKERLGGRIRIALVGGAPLAVEISSTSMRSTSSFSRPMD